ncbi:hypothetical protein [uncultured Dokdonia sp.]|uniref:hypothetical protein n=1 Tax=unclassified Dokdonia TaxID=2615033 RepID=UPI002607D5A5|nr:hypothetical protein [uncultured Dokdonia sp.]
MKLYIMCFVFFFTMISVNAQTYNEDIKGTTKLTNVELVEKDIVTKAALGDFGIGTAKNTRNATIQGNSVFITQIGDFNAALLNVKSRASEVNIEQNGDFNFTGLNYNVETVITDIKQEGNRNVVFDIVQDRTANISLDLEQQGNNLNFQRLGSNSLTESLQFIQTAASPSLIIRSSTNGTPDN